MMEHVQEIRLKSSEKSSATTATSASSSHQCAGCSQLIKDRYLLQALESYWHEDCLKCGCCGCRLGEVGANLFTRANLILCKRDYLRLFGTTGNCAACCKVIPAFEMVMRAKSNVYHLDCFACQQCHQRFCVGDRFYLCDNQILCEYDYEERVMFASLTTSSTPTTPRVALNAAANDSHQFADSTLSAGGAAYRRANGGVHFPMNGPTLPPPPPRREQQNRSTSSSTSSSDTSRFLIGAGSGGVPLATSAAPSAHKQDSPTSSSGYGSPDSGLIDER